MADFLNKRKTMDFITTVLGNEQDRNIDFLTIHPRTRSTPSSIPINLEALEILTSTYGDKVPILLSGDVFTLNALPFSSPLHQIPTTAPVARPSDLGLKPRKTEEAAADLKSLPKLAGMMSARALLTNPALFAGHDSCPWEAVEIFMNNVAKAPLPLKLVIHHVSEMCGPGFGKNKQGLLSKKERMVLVSCSTMCELIDFLDDKIGVRNGVRGLRRGLFSPTSDGCT